MHTTKSDTARQRVVIVGGGFAGLFAAQRLSRRDAAKEVTVTLIDRNNYHTFQPLLYQVAAAELEPESIAYPIRGIFRHAPNVTTIMSEATGLDLKRRLVLTDGPALPYDQLVLAPGSRTAFFGVPGAERNAFTLKSLEEAVNLRNHILACFERAALEGEAAPEGLLTVAIVGAGPTGLEFAGALAELMASPLAKDFPRLKGPKPRVVLVDAAEDVLMPFAPELRVYARQKLESMGVKVHVKSGVREVAPNAVTLTDGTEIRACTIVWAAGVQGGEFGEKAGLPLGRGGRVPVTPTLQVTGRPEIHVVGDMALTDGKNPPPMVAPNAIQQGLHAAKNILLAARGRATTEFVYKDKGSMVTIGRNSGVAQIKNRRYRGYVAWALWLSVHLMYLIGFRNRILVLMNWAWDYLFFERAVRLILPRVDSVLKVCGMGTCTADDELRQ
ncbi:MAG: NAD(P)/FAD-dependent oxidoreductase [Deltaproteobacteria bacterium]|jgi:NADH dehydrogenase|nr:NAD(P)/FAD-dependent oxidoreductase [Deltaproteobacteria bacterium]